jgi:hypothetical protein
MRLFGVRGGIEERWMTKTPPLVDLHCNSSTD